MINVEPELLVEVKENLFITWTEEDEAITRIIKRGIKRIEALVGTGTMDFTDEVNRDLLINWCRYERNSASEFFLENFADEVLFIQLQEAIKAGDVDATT